LFRDGKLIYMMQRSDIEYRDAEEIAGELTSAFDKFCAKTAPANR
jgi:putative YphP/YqiW family bacilliredoxin